MNYSNQGYGSGSDFGQNKNQSLGPFKPSDQ